MSDDPFFRYTAEWSCAIVCANGCPPTMLPKIEIGTYFADVALVLHNENGGELLRIYAKKFEHALNPDQVKHCARYALWDDAKLHEFVEPTEARTPQ